MGWVSHVGLVSDNNEDSFICDPALGLYAVADGMGGHAAGEVAAAVALYTLHQRVADGESLVTAVQLAHRAVHRAAAEGLGAEGMGATVVAVRLRGPRYEVAWVGDSRAYLWNGGLHQLSHDHSFVQRLVDSGNLDEAEARAHPYRNVITQSLGAADRDQVEVGYQRGVLLRGQWLLLCSDGLTDELDDPALEAVLSAAPDPAAAAGTLLEQALAAGGRDNITIGVIAAPADAPQTMEEARRLLQPPRWPRLLWLAAAAAAGLLLYFWWSAP